MTPLDTETPGDLWKSETMVSPQRKPDQVPILNFDNITNNEDIEYNAQMEEAGQF